MINREDRSTKQKSPAKRFLFILGLVMFVLYLVVGLAVIFWKDIPLQLERPYKVIIGVFLILYAFLRFIRLRQDNSL